MTIYVGIEGVGARQCVAVCSDEEGTVLASHRMFGEPLSINALDRRVMRNRLDRLLDQVLKPLSIKLRDLGDCVMCIGLAGVTDPYETEQRLLGELDELEIKPGRFICTGELEIILASHALSMQGGVVLCSTDSAALAYNSLARVRVGGWGTSIGDDGSGYWIGREAVRSIVNEYDAGAPPSTLWRCLEEWMHEPSTTRDYMEWKVASILWREHRRLHRGRERPVDHRPAFLKFANSMAIQHQWEWRAIVAALTIPLMQAWASGDTTAARIVDSAADSLASKYRTACLRAGVTNSVSPLILYGGVLTHHHAFRALIVDKVGQRVSPPEVILTPQSANTMRPACGALMYALGHSETGDLRLPERRVIDNLLHAQSVDKSGGLAND